MKELLPSARLAYRALDHASLQAFHALARDEHVRRYLLDGAVVDEDWSLGEVERSDELFAQEGVGLWLIDQVAPSDQLQAIGFCGFRVFEEIGPSPQLLYAFPLEHSGKGYATEAGAALVAHARALGWPRIESAVDEPNKASLRVLEKLGFAPFRRMPGEFGDVIVLELRLD